MNSMQWDVHDFLLKHLGHDPDDPKWPAKTGVYNKWLLIQEEHEELRHAIGVSPARYNNYDEQRFDEPAVIKEICDLLYVIYNLCEEMRIDITPFFNAVHASNMTKTPAALSDTKKIQKGPNYVPPDIHGLLARYRSE